MYLNKWKINEINPSRHLLAHNEQWQHHENA